MTLGQIVGPLDAFPRELQLHADRFVKECHHLAGWIQPKELY